jgi:membrane protein implicated in regulation of membrane protease activity
VFGLVSLLALVGVRPTLQHHLHAHAESAPMGLEAIEGSTGLVLERIDMDHGLIKIDGELWTARPYDASQSFETGDRVRVIEVRGATALVWKE